MKEEEKKKHERSSEDEDGYGYGEGMRIVHFNMKSMYNKKNINGWNPIEMRISSGKRHSIYLYDCLPRTGVTCIFVYYHTISISLNFFDQFAILVVVVLFVYIGCANLLPYPVQSIWSGQ